MRTKTIDEMCEEAIKYLKGTFQIEIGKMKTLMRETELAEIKMMSSLDVHEEQLAKLVALELCHNMIALNTELKNVLMNDYRSRLSNIRTYDNKESMLDLLERQDKIMLKRRNEILNKTEEN